MDLDEEDNSIKKKENKVCLYFCFLYDSQQRMLSSAYNLCKHLDPDQARENVRSGLDPDCLTRWDSPESFLL